MNGSKIGGSGKDGRGFGTVGDGSKDCTSDQGDDSGQWTGGGKAGCDVQELGASRIGGW